MGILDFVEKAAGALAAEKALEAADPNANLIEKAAVAVVGYEGVGALKDGVEALQDHFSKAEAPSAGTEAAPADQASQDQAL